MRNSVIGTNAALRYLKNYQGHVDYWRELNPTTAVAYVDKPDHTVYIEQYMDALPNTLVVGRIHHELDGGFHLAPQAEGATGYYVTTPVSYHNAYGFLGRKKNGILNVMNEPNGFGSDDDINRLVRWMVEYISIAAREKTKSVLFNWGDRQPRIEIGMMDDRFSPVLQLMAGYPELFFMGMHFYGPDEITSHLESYVKRCERLGIIPPRVIGTEFGFDKTDGQENGYVSRGYSGGAYAWWQIEQVQHELAYYIKRGVLIGLDLFQEGNSGGWDAFDTENDKGYKDEIKRSALAGELTMEVTQTTTPSYGVYLFSTGNEYTLQSARGERTNVRSSPAVVAGNILGNSLEDKTVVKLLAFKQVGIDYWYKITVDDRTGWISGRGGEISFTPVPVPPVVIVDDPPPVVTPTPDPIPNPPYPEVSAVYAAQMASVYKALADTYAAMAESTRETAAQWAKLSNVINNVAA